eukprot:10525476-Lingulodinium_polyedra.AAC.1
MIQALCMATARGVKDIGADCCLKILLAIETKCGEESSVAFVMPVESISSGVAGVWTSAVGLLMMEVVHVHL